MAKIRINENDIRQMVNESVKKILREFNQDFDNYYIDEKSAENETSLDNKLNLSMLKEKIISLFKNEDYNALRNMYDEYGVWFPLTNMVDAVSIENMFIPIGNTDVCCLEKNYFVNKKRGTITNKCIREYCGEYWDETWSKLFYTNNIKYVLNIYRDMELNSPSIFPSLVSKDNVNYYRINDEGKQIGPTYTKASPHFGYNKTKLLMDETGIIYCYGGLELEDYNTGNKIEKNETEPIIKKDENVIIGHYDYVRGVDAYCYYNFKTKELFNIESGISNLLIYPDVEYIRDGNKYVFFKIN